MSRAALLEHTDPASGACPRRNVAVKRYGSGGDSPGINYAALSTYAALSAYVACSVYATSSVHAAVDAAFSA